MKKQMQGQTSALVNLLSASNLKIDSAKELNPIFEETVEKLRSESHRKHGFRIESMFAYVAGALGKCLLVKQEDAGGVCLTSKVIDMQVPDYRLVLDNSECLLVEVKNCAKLKVRFKKNYISRLQRYADLQNVPLKIAVYWSKLKIWVLLPSEKLKFVGENCDIKFDEAIARSQMATLGDMRLACKVPLKVEMKCDSKLLSEGEGEDVYEFIPRAIDIYCDGVLIECDVEKEIAFQIILAVSATWDETMETAAVDSDSSVLHFKFLPPEINDEQDWEGVGSLSTIISQKFDNRTVTDGEVESLAPGCDFSYFEFFIPDDYQGKYFPLLRLIIQPNEEYVSPIRKAKP